MGDGGDPELFLVVGGLSGHDTPGVSDVDRSEVHKYSELIPPR